MSKVLTLDPERVTGAELVHAAQEIKKVSDGRLKQAILDIVDTLLSGEKVVLLFEDPPSVAK